MKVTQGRGVLAAFAAIYLIWGSTFLAIRFAVETLPPFTMTGIRCLIAGAALYGWARWRGERAPAPRGWIVAVLGGALLFPGGQGLLAWAEQHVPSGVAALFLAVEPLWMLVFQVFIGDGHGGKRTVLGMAAGTIGLVILASPTEVLGAAPVYPPGAVALLAGAVLWAAGSAVTRKVTIPGSPALSSGMFLVAGGMVNLVVGLTLGEAPRFVREPASLASLLALSYLIAAGSVAAFGAYHWLLQRRSMTAVATHGFVNPVVAVGLGWLVAGETISWRVIAAMALVVFAVALVLSAPQPSAQAQSRTAAHPRRDMVKAS